MTSEATAALGGTEWGVIGESSRGFPAADGGTLSVRFVLVRGASGDVACYAGVGPARWVALSGAKVGLAESKTHWPGLAAHLEAAGLWWRGPA